MELVALYRDGLGRFSIGVVEGHRDEFKSFVLSRSFGSDVVVHEENILWIDAGPTDLGKCQCEHIDHLTVEVFHPGGVNEITPASKHEYGSVPADTTLDHSFNVCRECRETCHKDFPHYRD